MEPNKHHAHTEYIYIYNNTEHLVKPGEDIPLDNNGIQTDAFIHNYGSSVIVIKCSGVYKITMNLHIDTSANQIALVLNNRIYWGTVYGSGCQTTWGQTIIALNEGDVIAFRNVSGEPIHLPSTYYDIFNITNTSVLIQKIGEKEYSGPYGGTVGSGSPPSPPPN